MPAYEFDLVNQITGEVIHTIPVVLPVDERNALVCKRREIPRSLVVAGSSTGNNQSAEVLNGYYQKELQEGSRFKSSFTKDQIKKAWSTP